MTHEVISFLLIYLIFTQRLYGAWEAMNDTRLLCESASQGSCSDSSGCQDSVYSLTYVLSDRLELGRKVAVLFRLLKEKRDLNDALSLAPVN